MTKPQRKQRKVRRPRKPYLKNYDYLHVRWYQTIGGSEFVRFRIEGVYAETLSAKQCRSLGERLILAADYLESKERE